MKFGLTFPQTKIGTDPLAIRDFGQAAEGAAEYEALNEDFHTRGARQEEQIVALRELWTEDLVTFKGRWHSFDRVGIAPRPLRPIPVWIGGGFAERILNRVARVADGWMPMLMPGHGQDEANVIRRLRVRLSLEKRDLASFGLQASMAIQPGREEDSISYARRLQSLGFTHFTVGGLGARSTAAETLAQGIAARDLLKSTLAI